MPVTLTSFALYNVVFFLRASTLIFILHKYFISYMLLLFSLGFRSVKNKGRGSFVSR
jgi:hypothetical protein